MLSIINKLINIFCKKAINLREKIIQVSYCCQTKLVNRCEFDSFSQLNIIREGKCTWNLDFNFNLKSNAYVIFLYPIGVSITRDFLSASH